MTRAEKCWGICMGKGFGSKIAQSFFIPTCLWRWNSVFRNVGIWNSDSGELPRRKHTTFVHLLVLAITCYIIRDRPATATCSAPQNKKNLSWARWNQSAQSRQISATPMSVFNGAHRVEDGCLLFAASYGIWNWKWSIQKPDLGSNMESVGASCKQWQFCDAVVQCCQRRSVLRASESLRFLSVWTLHVEW